jgi:uncharacterized protein YlxP (DUF503 family)
VPHLAVLRIDLHFPEAGSLKAKRAQLNAIKAGLQQRVGASVSEVDHQDTWQRSTLLAAVCAGSAGRAETGADALQRWLDGRLPQGVHVERRIVSWSDLESLG